MLYRKTQNERNVLIILRSQSLFFTFFLVFLCVCLFMIEYNLEIERRAGDNHNPHSFHLIIPFWRLIASKEKSKQVFWLVKVGWPLSASSIFFFEWRQSWGVYPKSHLKIEEEVQRYRKRSLWHAWIINRHFNVFFVERG